MTSVSTAGGSRVERPWALAVVGVAFLLRLPYAFAYRFNSDEPQHLHVVWGWTHGLVQYRDIFDNHPPLFHLAMAPVLAAVGERAAALPVMRLALLPFWVAALGLTWAIARPLYSPRAALWAVAVLAAFPDFFFTSLEFRTDVPWTVAWLGALAVLLGGPPTASRALASGLLLGVAMAISQKTVLLVLAVAGAAVVALAAVPAARTRVPFRRATALAASWMAGLAVVPALVVAGFAAAGALQPMFSCTVADNLVPGIGAWSHPWRILLFPVGLALLVVLARRAWGAASGGVHHARLLVLLSAAIYVLALETLWPLVTGQDWLPVDPLAAILLVGGVTVWVDGAAGGHPARRRRVAAAAVLAAVLATEVSAVALRGPVWVDRGRRETDLVRDVLRLTDPADVVIDAKGETVFRRRAWTRVLETVTRERLRRGEIRDSLVEDVVSTGCCVATLDDPRFTLRDREFLDAGFVAVGRLRVAGRLLEESAARRGVFPFRVAVPAVYTVVDAAGPVSGTLDGSPLTGGRALEPGVHEFEPAAGAGPLAVVWAQAVARGFTPFARREGGR